MEHSTSRLNILKKIKQALQSNVPVPFSDLSETDCHFLPAKKEMEIEFAKNFSELLGNFSYCENQQELAAQLSQLIQVRKWTSMYCREDFLLKFISSSELINSLQQDDLPSCDAAITGCEVLIARTGSIMLSSAQQSGRTVSVYAPVHICIAFTNQLVYDIKDGLQFLQEKYNNHLPSMFSIATGPSRTADIEKTLVTGVHGPKEVFCFLVEHT